MATTEVKDVLSTYVRKIQNDIREKIEDVPNDGTTDDSESKVLLTLYSDKSQTISQKIENSGDSLTTSSVSKILIEIAKLVLDVTYVEEVNLIDAEFPQGKSEPGIKYVFESLKSLEDLSQRAAPQSTLLESLGGDVLECIRWRCGALLYMYCHTLNSKGPGNGFPEKYMQTLEDGAHHLTKMIGTRSKSTWLQDCNSTAEDENEILEGIYSDTHLLALMYCGEMCYWHVQASTHDKKDNTKNTESSSSSLSESVDVKCSDSDDKTVKESSSEKGESRLPDSPSPQKEGNDSTPHANIGDIQTSSSAGVPNLVQTGISCLRKYIRASEGPLVAGGWCTTRAKELLEFLGDLK